MSDINLAAVALITAALAAYREEFKGEALLQFKRDTITVLSGLEQNEFIKLIMVLAVDNAGLLEMGAEASGGNVSAEDLLRAMGLRHSQVQED